MRTQIENWLKNNVGTYSFMFLLTVLIFFAPVIGRSEQGVIYQFLLTLIFFGVVLQAPKHWRVLLWVAVGITLISWLSYSLNMPVLYYLSEILNLLLFGFGVLILIAEVASQKSVSAKVIMDAINGYFLLGLFFTIIIGLVHKYNPASLSFPEQAVYNFSDYNYFSFITLTTLGYGDITPQTPIARSLAMLTCVSGQLYLTVIVALLVGKYQN